MRLIERILVATFLSTTVFTSALAAYADSNSNPLVNVADLANGHHPRIAVDKANHFHAVFEGLENDSDVPHICYSQSLDGGKTWSQPKDISNSGPNAAPAVHADVAVEPNGALDVVWSDLTTGKSSADIFIARSTDGGASFSQPKDISNTPGMSSEPALAIGPDNAIHVIWSDTSTGEKNRDIYYCCSTDGGKTYSKDPLLPAINISRTKGYASDPVIAVSADGRVHIAWLDTTSGADRPDVYYVVNSQGKWSTITNVSNSARLSAHPCIAAGDGRVYVGWVDFTKKEHSPDIWCSIGGRRGIFERPLNISNTPGVSSEPVIAADSSKHLIIAWSDTTCLATSSDIFCRVSTDQGRAFSPIVCLTASEGPCKHPSIAIAQDRMIALWEATSGSKSIVRAGTMAIEGLPSRPADQAQPIIRGRVGGR